MVVVFHAAVFKVLACPTGREKKVGFHEAVAHVKGALSSGKRQRSTDGSVILCPSSTIDIIPPPSTSCQLQ